MFRPTSCRPISRTRPRRLPSDQFPFDPTPIDLSATALLLLVCSALESACTARPEFVSDRFLDTISDDITLASIELVLNEHWRRRGDGYEIRAPGWRRTIAVLHELQRPVVDISDAIERRDTPKR